MRERIGYAILVSMLGQKRIPLTKVKSKMMALKEILRVIPGHALAVH